jgi:hypothetical protein
MAPATADRFILDLLGGVNWYLFMELPSAGASVVDVGSTTLNLERTGRSSGRPQTWARLGPNQVRNLAFVVERAAARICQTVALE